MGTGRSLLVTLVALLAAKASATESEVGLGGGLCKTLGCEDAHGPPTRGETLLMQLTAKQSRVSAGDESHPPDCVGRFSDWGQCSDTCTHTRTFHVSSPAQAGGKPCEHSDKFLETQPCVGGHCAHEELAPAGELPGEDKPEANVHHLALGLQLPLVAAIIGSILLAELLHHTPYVSALPHSLVVVLVSGIVGVCLRIAHGQEGWQTEHFSPVTSSLMNLVLLPIIIFQSGWAIPLKPFWKNFGYILIFALVGTAVSTFSIAWMIHASGRNGYHVVSGFREALAIAALISATDPVATLATFASKQVEPTLNALVFGEATINDAVAIAFFKLINIDQPTSTFTWSSAAVGALKMLIGSVALGLITGVFLTLILRGLSKICKPQLFSEVLYIFSAAYLTNAIAESCHTSGIIACLFSGILMGIYARAHLSSAGEKAADSYLDISAKVADQSVFVMVGITTALIRSSRGTRFGLYLFAFCLLGRFVSVGLCSMLCNIVRKCRAEPTLVTPKRTFMLWHAGLRGGIALTLVLELNDWAEHKAVLVTAVFIAIFLLLVLMGGTTDFALNSLGIERNADVPDSDYAVLHASAAPCEGDPMALKAVKCLHTGLHDTLVGDAALQAKAQPQTDEKH